MPLRRRIAYTRKTEASITLFFQGLNPRITCCGDFYCKWILNVQKRLSKRLRKIKEFIWSKEMNGILESFNTNVSLADDIFLAISQMLHISEQWDFRNQMRAYDKKTGENARWLISDETITHDQKNAVMGAIDFLGLRSRTMPLWKAYEAWSRRIDYANRLIYR